MKETEPQTVAAILLIISIFLAHTTYIIDHDNIFICVGAVGS